VNKEGDIGIEENTDEITFGQEFHTSLLVRIANKMATFEEEFHTSAYCFECGSMQ